MSESCGNQIAQEEILMRRAAEYRAQGRAGRAGNPMAQKRY
jgi:hypothetical protein